METSLIMNWRWMTYSFLIATLGIILLFSFDNIFMKIVSGLVILASIYFYTTSRFKQPDV